MIGDPNDPNDRNKPGALHWKTGNLAYPGGTSTILGIRLAGNICGDGAGHHANIFCDVIDGDVTVAGTLSEVGAGAPTLRKLQANCITGDITLGGMYGDIVTGSLDGDVTVGDTWGGRTHGDFRIYNDYDGTMCLIDPTGYDGHIFIAGGLVDSGRIEVAGANFGSIDLGGDLVTPARIISHSFLGQSNNSLPPSIRVRGDLVGEEDPNDPNNLEGVPVRVGTTTLDPLMGTIVVDGSIYGYAIAIAGQFRYGTTMAAVTADYDGGELDDKWQPGAYGTALRPEVPHALFQFSGNIPECRVWDITECIGDLNNNGTLDLNDPNDPNGLSSDHNALILAIGDPDTDPNAYGYQDEENGFPGLYGSRMYHGDVNCDGELDDDDLAALDWVVSKDCCMSICAYRTCYADLNEDGQVDLPDLAQLLGNYGTTSGATRDDGDVYPLYGGDGAVGLADLAELNGHYGHLCNCFGGAGLGDGPSASYITITVVPYDTHGYTGGGFYGKVDHFVFDLKIQVGDPNNADDWLVNGAALDASNDATFRLSTSSTTPNAYATFVAAPWTTLPGSATATVAGGYDPPDPNEVFTTTALNLGWYDTDTDSEDGPAAVMRLVIDVSGVKNADVSGGFGSVYFSTTGPAAHDDILVADLASGTASVRSAPRLETYSGEFYVVGE